MQIPKIDPQMELRTERLVLKGFDERFADRTLDYYTRNREFLKPWEPKRNPEFFTLDFQETLLRQDIAQAHAGQACRLWIFREADRHFERTLGVVVLSNIVYGVFLSAILGYKLDELEIGRGYTTEALQALIDYAFDDIKLHRIEANIMPRNLPSIRVVEKLGFVNEGIARKYLKINGTWEDHIHMVLLNQAIENDQDSG